MARFPVAKFLVFASSGMLCVSILCGCQGLSSTAQYYHPAGTKSYAAKADSAPMEILYIAPARPYKVIGQFSYSHTFVSDGEDYLDEVLKYNGRKAGADAVYVVDKKVTESTAKGQAIQEETTDLTGEKRPAQKISLEAEMIVFGS